MTGLVASHRPGDDLLSELIAAGLDTDQVVALAQQLLFAGHEPTTNLIGNAVIALVRNPGTAAPDLDELMRYDGPTARASPRYATEDLEIGGVAVPEGSVVIVGIAAANRDPRRFSEPDVLGLSRVDNPHLSFGHGIHRCVGAALARMEGEVALDVLLHRFPDLSLAAEPEWLPFPVFRGVSSLSVRARPA
ncbi:cytochrome P450 [Lentzea sp. NPDC054927]